MKEKKHLIIIGILVIVFFGLIFLSTNDSNIKVDYNFNNIAINSLNAFENQPSVGAVEIVNSGILPKKVYLKNLRVCYTSSIYDDGARIDYLGNVNREYNDIFYSNDLRYFEIKAKSTEKIDLSFRFSDYSMYELITKNNLTNGEGTFYVFDVSEVNNPYDYCSYANKDDAFSSVNVVFNIPQEELNKFYKNEYK